MFEVIITKGELYDKCENIEQLYDRFYYPLLVEYKELKKQVENYKKLGFKYLQDKNNNLETQQKKFINYLEDEIKLYENDIQNFSKDYNVYFSLINDLRASKAKIEDILQKYKSIIGEIVNESKKENI